MRLKLGGCLPSIVRRRRQRLHGISQAFRFSTSVAESFSTARNAAPFRMAVVGSGPAGFYTAHRVMNRIPHARIDMYETLPVPFGLVRFGVAPDHPEVKNCQDKFTEIAESPNFQFLGNVSIGGSKTTSAERCEVKLQSLLQHYDSVLFAYGASEDKKLGIPGESTLNGIYSARDFVGWYNGFPSTSALEPDLTVGDEAVIIGQGNVALDVARILLQHVDVLRKTDITEQALEALSRSRIKRVHVVGRRGPMQAAFTIKEVRELMSISDVHFPPVDRSLIPEDVKSLPRAQRRLMEVLIKGTPQVMAESIKHWHLQSCLSPTEFLANAASPKDIASTEFAVTQLANPFNPQSRVTTTARSVMIPSSIAFRSVGYKSVPLPGFAEAGIQFDEGRGVVVNDGIGRLTRSVADVEATHAVSLAIPGLYVAGWVKRGPTGVIASTMQDAHMTGDAIVQDWQSGANFLQPGQNTRARGWDGVKEEIGTQADLAVSWAQWRDIDSEERRRGQSVGKEREKFTSTRDMLAVLK